MPLQINGLHTEKTAPACLKDKKRGLLRRGQDGVLWDLTFFLNAACSTEIVRSWEDIQQ